MSWFCLVFLLRVWDWDRLRIEEASDVSVCTYLVPIRNLLLNPAGWSLHLNPVCFFSLHPPSQHSSYHPFLPFFLFLYISFGPLSALTHACVHVRAHTERAFLARLAWRWRTFSFMHTFGRTLRSDGRQSCSTTGQPGDPHKCRGVHLWRLERWRAHHKCPERLFS